MSCLQGDQAAGGAPGGRGVASIAAQAPDIPRWSGKACSGATSLHRASPVPALCAYGRLHAGQPPAAGRRPAAGVAVRRWGAATPLHGAGWLWEGRLCEQLTPTPPAAREQADEADSEKGTGGGFRHGRSAATV